MVEIIVCLRHRVRVIAPEMLVNLPLSVCLELALVAEEGEILVKIANMGPQILLPHGLVAAMFTSEAEAFVDRSNVHSEILLL